MGTDVALPGGAPFVLALHFSASSAHTQIALAPGAYIRTNPADQLLVPSMHTPICSAAGLRSLERMRFPLPPKLLVKRSGSDLVRVLAGLLVAHAFVVAVDHGEHWAPARRARTQMAGRTNP